MEKFIKGDVVVVPFPFSNLTQAKLRPALDEKKILEVINAVVNMIRM